MQKETMQEMNEKYKNFPVKTTEYEIDGRRYIVGLSLFSVGNML